jgi:uncharacterized membrane protein
MLLFMNSESAARQIDRAGALFIAFGGVAGVIGILGYFAGGTIDFGPAGLSLLTIAVFCIFTIVANVAARSAFD